jgi:hypothetical protein
VMPCSLLPPQLWQSVPFQDRDAWEDFGLHHQLWHQILAEATKTPVLTFDDLKVELLRHNEIHAAVSNALGIPAAVDLTEFDLNDRGSYYSWMQTHALDHLRFRQAAGL